MAHAPHQAGWRSRWSLARAYLRRRAAVDRGPSVVTVETTTRCNLACTFCHRRHATPPAIDLPMSLFRDLVEDDRHAIDLINLFGMGEPLLDPHLIERIALCRTRGVRTHVCTNATLLNPTRSREMLEAGVDAITFSVDTLRPDLYRSLRPGGDYQQTVAGIVDFLAARRALRPDRRPMAVVQMFATPQTVSEKSAVERFWLSRGVDHVRLCFDEFHGHPKEPARRTAVPCSFLWYGPALVRADGGLYPCCDAGLARGAAARLGETTLFDFWTGPVMTDIRAARLRKQRHTAIACYACLSQKPAPVFAAAANLIGGVAARRWGIRLEKKPIIRQWGVLYRETR